MTELTLQVDGKNAVGYPGDTILQVCERNGIYVPTLCHFQGLTNPGTCRMCSVEVEGQRGFTTACTTPAASGMVVRTETPALTELRRSVLQLLFAERNHYCPYCEISGECELQALAYRYGIDHFKYPFLFPALEVDSSPQHFALDHNRCVLCTRCVRVCGELVANETLGPMRRGSQTLITADLEESIGRSSCVACGNCVQVCPTGALYDKRRAYLNRSSKTKSQTASVCPGCSLGCPVVVVSTPEQILRIDGDFGSPVYQGLLCEQGRYGTLVEVGRRHLRPLVRRASRLEEVTQDAVVDLVARELRGHAEAARGAAIAGVISPRATNETAYLFQKLFRTGLGSNNLRVLGEDPSANHYFTTAYRGASLADVEKADYLLVLGTDPTRAHQALGFAIKRALRAGASLTLVAPADNGLGPLAQEHLVPAQPEYGVFVNGLMQSVLGLGLAGRLTGGKNDHFVAEIAKYTPNAVAKRTGIPETLVGKVAAAYARAMAPIVVWAGDDDGWEAAVLSLSMLTGNYDGQKARVLRLGEAVNTRGTREMGAISGYLPGRVTWESPLGQRLAKSLGSAAPKDPGSGGLAVAYFLLSDDPAPVDEAALRIARKARFVVVQEAYRSALDEVASVVIPSPTWAEKEGTFISADGTSRDAMRVFDPPPGVAQDWRILAELLATIGSKKCPESLQEIFSEIAALVPGYGEQATPSGRGFAPVCVGF